MRGRVKNTSTYKVAFCQFCRCGERLSSLPVMLKGSTYDANDAPSASPTENDRTEVHCAPWPSH